MFKYFIKRILATPLILLILITLSFFLIRLAPGDPFSEEKAISKEVKAKFEEKYGLDKPLHIQYFYFLGMISQGDLGLSMVQKEKTVNEIISEMLPPSLYLGGLALFLSLFLGITAGIFSAVKQNSYFDFTTMSLAVLGISLPVFLIGPLLKISFAMHWKIFPSEGYEGIQIQYLVLPAITLALPFAARIARLMRAGMLDSLSQEYIKTAKAKGLNNRQVVFGHALYGGILPVVSFLGPAIASITTGSLVVEKIFNLPGLGSEFVQSALNRDYFLVLGTVILYGSFIILCNLISDLIHGAIDPRIRMK
ncbi:MAG: ABC transporter [Planctomycetota bacterium]|nr:MAG: ABC transporter [Planctomycetota bacterium]